ncbi:MAG: hypothetical protein ABL897_04055 [Hyphomicrobium sp.]
MANNRHEPIRPQKDKGFALIAVIWIGVLLALIAAAFSSAVRSRIRSTAGETETVRAEALADAGIRIALLERLNVTFADSGAPRFPADGSTVMCAIGTDATLAVQVEDEDGKVNLNTLNADLLLALFAGLGATRSEARSYTDAIMDFRDEDDERRPDGAESADYARAAGAAPTAKNALFVSVDELDQVLGLPPELRDRAKRFLTVLSTQDGLDPAVAPSGLKTLLIRGSNGIVATDENRGDTSAVFIGSDLPPGFVSASRQRAYTIRSEAVLQSGARYVSDAVVAMPDGPAGVPIYQRWRRGVSAMKAGQPIPAPQTLPPC